MMDPRRAAAIYGQGRVVSKWPTSFWPGEDRRAPIVNDHKAALGKNYTRPL